MAKCAFIGLGVMGYPMAGHLAAKGHDGHRLQPHREPGRGVGGGARRRPRRHAGGRRRGRRDRLLPASATTPTCAASRSGRAAPSRGSTGGRSSSTTPPPRRRSPASWRAAAKARRGFVDAPVSGGQAGAENGALTVMCGGERDAYGAPSR